MMFQLLVSSSGPLPLLPESNCKRQTLEELGRAGWGSPGLGKAEPGTKLGRADSEVLVSAPLKVNSTELSSAQTCVR